MTDGIKVFMGHHTSISVGKFFSDLLPIDLTVVIYKIFLKVSIITLPKLPLASLQLEEDKKGRAEWSYCAKTIP